MRKVKSYNTTPEVLLRRSLTQRGLHVSRRKLLPGKPDAVISRHRVAVFVDGDFWHGNQWHRRGLDSVEEQFARLASKAYWIRKIRRNMDRDCRVTDALFQSGWHVIRFWESDITKNTERCAEMVATSITCDPLVRLRAALAKRTVAEFFAGIGLMRLGLQKNGWRVAFANDIDEQKRQMYLGHFKNANDHLSPKDIHLLSSDDVPDVSLATASFPCNDLSLAGARGGLSGKNSSAFWGFVQVLEGMGERRPPLVLIENVPGFLTSHGGQDFERALLSLNRLGYGVDPFVIDAVSFVPQSRQRMFIMGVNRVIVDTLRSPEPFLFAESEIRPKPLAKFIIDHPEIHWALRKLPKLPEGGNRLEAVLEDLQDDGSEWWSETRATYLYNQFSPKHKAVADRMIKGRKWSYGTVFRRIRNAKSMAELRTDGIAGCLRTPRGGSGRQILFKAGYGTYQARLLTPKECARLMGADDFVISGSLNQALFGFGDAVCVDVIGWIALHYLNPIVSESLRFTVALSNK